MSGLKRKRKDKGNEFLSFYTMKPQQNLFLYFKILYFIYCIVYILPSKIQSLQLVNTLHRWILDSFQTEELH